jgi:hypothetical protein
MNEHLQSALKHLWEAKPVVIGNREYDTVATRIAAFRRNFPMTEWRIRTTVTFHEEIVRGHRTTVTFHEEIVRGHSTIEHLMNNEWHVMAEGHAEEKRGGSAILKSSAVEVTETSAVGRALAMLGLGGGEVCSADELGVVEEHSEEFHSLDKLETREEMREAYKALTVEARNRLSEAEIKQLNGKFE